MPYGLSELPWFATCILMGGMLLWVAVVAFVVWATTRLFASRNADTETPLDILKKRYAKGEISAAEFQKAKDDLE